MDTKLELRGQHVSTLEVLCQELGCPKFRAKQIFKWVNKGVKSFDEMSDLPKDLREKLATRSYVNSAQIVQVLNSEKDGTRKYLFKLNDGNVIESVLMRYKHGNSVCVSTQVGCRMGCHFCASTIDGMVRNLTAGEILGQILDIQNDIDERVSNIVLMGSGEPLDNFNEVIRFLEIVNHKEGLNVSQRHITLSTCGIVPKIYELADLKYQITLAISLHSALNEERSELMPINKSYPIEALLDACDYYAEKTGRRITFEYALILGKNDREDKAKELAKLLKGRLCHVNLIPVNPVKERGYEASDNQSIEKFKGVLKRAGVETTVRRELGSDINAACGQLRKSHLESNQTE
jgi:23S rRNA (adenine2503-C2)-methyltransferase